MFSLGKHALMSNPPGNMFLMKPSIGFPCVRESALRVGISIKADETTPWNINPPPPSSPCCSDLGVKDIDVVDDAAAGGCAQITVSAQIVPDVVLGNTGAVFDVPPQLATARLHAPVVFVHLAWVAMFVLLCL